MTEVDPGKRMLAAVAYLFPFVSELIVFSDLRKDDFLRHHGWQAVSWEVVRLLILAYGLVVFTVLYIAPLADLGSRLALLMVPAAFLFSAISVYYAARALLGQRPVIPVLGHIAQRYAARRVA